MKAATFLRTCLLGIALLSSTSWLSAAIYANQVTGDFRKKIEEIATRLQIEPDWLIAAMALETAKPETPGKGTPTFHPAMENSKTHAVGLIQFTPKTAVDLGTTTAALRKCSVVEQLDWVEKYLADYKGRMKSLVDVYLAVFYPVGIGKPDSFTLPDWAYAGNEGLDVNGDHKISRAEIAVKIQRYFDKGVGK